MAEFTEVVRQMKRMCKAYWDKDCKDCPLYWKHKDLPYICTRYIYEEPCESERIIMDWAAAHPEPQYPTWEEWQKKNFPDAADPINPCAFVKFDKDRCRTMECEICRKEHIPAEIAEKLGINPEEVGSDGED